MSSSASPSQSDSFGFSEKKSPTLRRASGQIEQTPRPQIRQQIKSEVASLSNMNISFKKSNQNKFIRQPSKSREEILALNPLINPNSNKEPSFKPNDENKTNLTEEQAQQMEIMKQKLRRVGKNIDKMNDTLFICYYASKQGVKYRALVENRKSSNLFDQLDYQDEQ